MKTKDLTITDHAYVRYLEHYTKHIHKTKYKIEDIIRYGHEVIPLDSMKAIFANKFKGNTTYIRENNRVAVIRDNTVITIINFNKREWVDK